MLGKFKNGEMVEFRFHGKTYVGQYRGIDREMKSISNPYCHVVAFPSLNEKLNLGLREILAKDEELKRRR